MDKVSKLPNGGELREYDGGYKSWWLGNKRHREDGPAIEYGDGEKRWYLNDKHIPCKTQKEFERLMKLKAFW
jgi:hypothetical protein